jgi:hypothetical protein
MLMINSWYDISVGPSVAMYEYQSKNAANETARNNMFMVIAPTTHCHQGRMENEHTIVGQRDLRDARFDQVGSVQKWFDHFLKGMDNDVTSHPKVHAYMMGANQWRTYDTWPPKKAEYVSYYLDSGGKANTAFGDGRLAEATPSKGGFGYICLRPLAARALSGREYLPFQPELRGRCFRPVGD